MLLLEGEVKHKKIIEKKKKNTHHPKSAKNNNFFAYSLEISTMSKKKTFFYKYPTGTQTFFSQSSLATCLNASLFTILWFVDACVVRRDPPRATTNHFPERGYTRWTLEAAASFT